MWTLVPGLGWAADATEPPQEQATVSASASIEDAGSASFDAERAKEGQESPSPDGAEVPAPAEESAKGAEALADAESDAILAPLSEDEGIIAGASLLDPTEDAANDRAASGLVPQANPLETATFAMISRDAKPRSTSALSGFLQKDETLYAVAWAAKNKRVDDDGTWSYQWLYGSSTGATDFIPIEGETKSSLTLTDELRTQLDGKYLRVRIICGDKTVEGPKKPIAYKNLTACGPIKKPVPVKTALDDKSYVLIQGSGDATSTYSTVKGTLEMGDVLWANVYDSQAVPAARIATQDRWSYQWLYSFDKEASDAAYTPIEGQTSASLILTEELAAKLSGAYIRVRITGDDRTIYGPSGSFDPPSSISYNTPGPVVLPGQIKLDHILLSLNGSDYGSYEDTPDCNVGDTLEARTYDLDIYDSLYGPDEVDFSWQIAESEDGPFTEVATDAVFHADEPSGRFIKVVATAKNGIPGHDRCESPIGRIQPRGVSALSRIEILNASSAKFIGDKLVAQPYASNSWGEAPVSENVSYTWYWTDVRPGYGTTTPIWHEIENEAGPELAVTDDLEGRWVAVSANAGDNTVTTPDRSAAGPFRKTGTYELYYAALDQTPSDENFTFWTGRTIGVSARATNAAGTAGDYLTADQLNYTWLIADSYDGEYVELDDGNVHASSFVIPQSYEGKYLKCLVNAGFNTMEAGPTRKAIKLGEPIEPVDPEPADPQEPTTLDVTVRVTGVTPHAPGASFQQEAWIPTSSYTVTSTARVSAWDVFASMLDDAGYFYSLNGGCPYSITTPDRAQTLAMSSSAPWSYWSFLVNGTYADSLPSGYYPKNGDVIELVYVDATGTMTKPIDPVNPDAPVADWDASWSTYGSSATNPAVVQTTVSDLTSDWTLDFAQGSFASWSEPIVAGDFLFFTSGNQILKIDAATGAVVDRATLAESTAYGCRPVYANGMVIVPINNGRLQALSALDLTTVWLTDALPTHAISTAGATASNVYEQQSLSTLTLGNDCIYAFTTEADWSRTYGGYSLCIDLATGAVRWAKKNQSAGYYWTGAAHLNGFLLVAGDDGQLCTIAAESATGTPSGRLDLGAPVRSSILSSGDAAYVVTTDGILHKVTVGSTGQPRELACVAFADYSTSSPAIADNVIYVGGGKNGQGILVAIDVASMNVLGSVSFANDTALPGEVKSMPTLVRDADGIVALFTCNGAIGEYPDYTGGGGVYAYRLGDAQATLAFDPPAGMHNYSMGSIAYGLGRFYYVNDSGRLFALALASADLGPKPPAPEKETQNDKPDGDAQPNPAIRMSSITSSTTDVPASGDQIQENGTPLAVIDATAGSIPGESVPVAYVLLGLALVGVAISVMLLVSGTRKRS